MMKELLEKFKRGEMEEEQFDQEMFRFHNLLFDYCGLIKQNPVCKKIEIVEQGVVCYFLVEEQTIKMFLHGDDLGSVSSTLLDYGNYEKEELTMLMKLVDYLDPDGVVMDVGANLGWYTLNIKAKKRGMTAYMFEPVIQTFERMNTNIAINEMKGCHCFNIGLYETNGEMSFYFDKTATGASSLRNLRQHSETKTVRVNMRKLDDVVAEQNITRIDLIKCDVEGSELFVYKGGITSIEKYKPVIFSEMLRKWSAKFDYHPNQIIALLAGLGYECFVIQKGQKLAKLQEVTEETIETNYFFLHTQKHQQIIQELCI